MGRTLLAVVLSFATALALTAARGAGGGPRTLFRQRRVAVPRPSIPQPQRVPQGRTRLSLPQRDEAGAKMSKPAASAPPAEHAAVVRSAAVARRMTGIERAEITPNRHYWHNEGGLRYSHYYDGRVHWYGFYHGPTFYWTRYYGDRWWWYDAGFGRWVFWWDGFWWWPAPGGLAYVYVDDNYYPYEASGVTVQRAESQTPPASVPAPGQSGSTSSPDGRRLVQIVGSDAQAFLYDKTVSPPAFLRFLGAGAAKIRYSGGKGGAPLQILVEFKDDSFALFDADGESQKAAIKTAEPHAAPAEAPDSIPPPPGSPPGQ